MTAAGPVIHQGPRQGTRPLDATMARIAVCACKTWPQQAQGLPFQLSALLMKNSLEAKWEIWEMDNVDTTLVTYNVNPI